MYAQHDVDRLGVAVERGADVLRRVALHALAAAPHHVDRRAELGAEVDRVDRLAQRVRRTFGSLAVNAPSLKIGCENRFVVAIGTRSPVSSSARGTASTIWLALGRASSRAARGRRRGSSRRTRRARRDGARRRPDRAAAASRGRTGRGPRLPTVQSPKVKRSRGVGVYCDIHAPVRRGHDRPPCLVSVGPRPGVERSHPPRRLYEHRFLVDGDARVWIRELRYGFFEPWVSREFGAVGSKDAHDVILEGDRPLRMGVEEPVMSPA